MRTASPDLGFAARCPILVTLVVLVLVAAVSLAAVVSSFDAVGVAVFPLAVILSLGIPAVLVPVVVLPLLLAIRRQHELHAELERQARVDALTDLPNRRAFFDFARAVVKRQTIVGTPMAAMMIDVDKFKTINDSFGHDHGDMVLKRVAETILAEVTSAEAPRWMVARLGGEEFVALIDGLAPSAIARLAERICNQVHRSVGAGERLDPVTVSVGVAFRKQGQGIDKLLKASDDAVYAAKRAGRDRWAFASDGGTPPEVAPQPVVLQEAS
jgi:diguanylate cyclase (GGDEF)-like protein